MTRILFIGEAWQGSSARSLREALARIETVSIRDIAEDTFLPAYRRLPLRLANKVLHPFQRQELQAAVLRTLRECTPDAVLVYKGTNIPASFVRQIRSLGTPVANVFPDYSPHAYGGRLKEALGVYDLTISTKPFHPQLWKSEYGYVNSCVFVPHGYDPDIHYWPESPQSPSYDVALCGNWRPEYHSLMSSFAKALDDAAVSVAIAGAGWPEHAADFPSHWHCFGPRVARSYGEFLRSARIAVAPVNRHVVIRGVTQHGDEDTTRTYELAAARCFFLHQRTDYVSTVYDECTEVPLWGDAHELAALVRRWLPDERGRRAMADRAHARAVPAYSIPERALTVLRHVEALVEARALVRVSR